MRICLISLLVVGATANAQPAGMFSATGNMMTARFEGTATLLPNGKVLFAGGQASTPGGIPPALASAELYDPSTGAFSATGNMKTARFLHSATTLADGRVLVAGGYGAFPKKQPLAGAELYDPSAGTFTATGDMRTAGAGVATLLTDGRVLIAHELLSPGPPAPAELYDPVTGTFSATGDQKVISVLGDSTDQRAALLPDGRVILISCCTQVQIYDPAKGVFSLTTIAELLRNGEQNFVFTMTLLTNCKVLLAGGGFFEGNAGDPISARAGLYDASTGTAAATANMTTNRGFHSATLLPDGTVLIAGGVGYVNNTAGSSVVWATAELFDPATATFSRTGDMIAARSGQTATLLLNGKVLIADGTADLYTPAVLVPAPVLFSLSGDGQGQGAIWHSATGQIASAASPAVAGEALSMYTTSLANGGVIPPQVAVGGRPAEVLYFGPSGYPGYNQVNVRVPASVAPGDSVLVRLTYLGRPSNGVMIGVQ